ncbi:single-stranded DNA binding protein, partial [Reticulomyxa filosa]
TRDESNVLKENKVFIVRAKLLYELCNHLKELCDKYNCIVIFINDVGDVFETKDILTIHSMENCIFSKGRYVKPALGLAWTNLMDTRIMLTRADEDGYTTYPNKMQSQPSNISRFMQVQFSPYMSTDVDRRWVPFVIDKKGVHGLPKLEDMRGIDLHTFQTRQTQQVLQQEQLQQHLLDQHNVTTTSDYYDQDQADAEMIDID